MEAILRARVVVLTGRHLHSPSLGQHNNPTYGLLLRNILVASRGGA